MAARRLRATGHPGGVRRDGAAARVISESEELVQGVDALLLLVLSLLAVGKSSSFCFEDVGQQSAEAASRWRPLQAILPGRKLLEPALVCALTGT